MNINKHKLLKQFFSENGYILADKYYWIKSIGEDLEARIEIKLSIYGKQYYMEYSWSVPSCMTLNGKTVYGSATAVPLIKNRKTNNTVDLNNLGIDEDEFVSQLIKELPFYMKYLESINTAQSLKDQYYKKLLWIRAVGKNLAFFGIDEHEFFKKTPEEKYKLLNIQIKKI